MDELEEIHIQCRIFRCQCPQREDLNHQRCIVYVSTSKCRYQEPPSVIEMTRYCQAQCIAQFDEKIQVIDSADIIGKLKYKLGFRYEGWTIEYPVEGDINEFAKKLFDKICLMVRQVSATQAFKDKKDELVRFLVEQISDLQKEVVTIKKELEEFKSTVSWH